LLNVCYTFTNIEVGRVIDNRYYCWSL